MKKTIKWVSILLLTASCLAQVTVTGGIQVTSSAVISWTASAGATSYNVLRGNTGGPYTQITIAGTVTTTTYTDSTAPKGQSCWVVQAVNNAGTSAFSSPEACGTIP